MATNPIAQALTPFIWGRGGSALTPEQVAREREIAEALIAQGIDTSPVGHWTQGAARMANVLAGKVREGRASRAEAEGRADQDELRAGLDLSSIFGGAPSTLSGSPATSTSMATAPAPDYPSARVARAHGGDMQAYRDAIASIESRGSGDYAAVGPRHSKLGRALGRYQVMEANIGPWSEKHLGRRVTPEEFLANPELQDAIFDAEFGSYVDRFGDPGMAAQAWFAGPGGVGTNRKDSLGTSVPEYASRFNAALANSPAVAANEAMASGEMPMGEPQMVSDVPVADIAQALTENQVNPDLPMTGNTSGFLPVAQALAGGKQQGGANHLQRALNLASRPWATDTDQMVARALLQQQMQQADPMRQLQMERAQLEIDAMRNSQQSLINAGGGNLYNPNTGEWISAPAAEGGLEGPAAYQTLALRARDAGLKPGTPEYQQFMAEGGRTTRDPENERRINALTDRGMSRQEAENIVYGFTQVVSDPVLGSPMIVDRTNATATPIDQGIGAGQAPSGPAAPPPGGSLYDLADVATGAIPGLQETWTAIAPQLGLPGVDGVTESRQIMNAASRDLIRALSINPRFPVGEMERIEKEINISPNKFTSPQALKERMKGVDTVLRRRLENERRTASNSQLPVESRRNALQAANDIENFLVTLGVPQDRGQGPQGAPQPGSIEDGYRFIGGDPADPNSWEPVQ